MSPDPGDPRHLPDPFPVRPLTAPPDVQVTVPGGRSITNRALICAALAEGTSRLLGAGLSDDTEAMTDCLRVLGAAIDVQHPDTRGADITVTGVAGRPRGGVEVFTRLSGTTSRFITAAAALADGPVRVDAHPPMQARPMKDLIDALRALAVSVDDSVQPGHLPLVVTGPLAGREVSVPGTVSSQFISGLLLAAGARSDELVVRVATDRLVSAPYVRMTTNIMRSFGVEVEYDVDRAMVVKSGGGYRVARYEVEPDAATAGYFLSAAAITGGRVRVPDLPDAALQADAALMDVLEKMGATVKRPYGRTEVIGPAADSDGWVRLRGGTFDLTAFSDMAPTVAALAGVADGQVEVTGVGFIRGKETDRIAAPVEELRRLGARADETDDGFVVWPGGRRAGDTLHGAVVRTYDDHRMAMAFALLGLVVPGVEIADPGCVAKTHPGYFADLERLRR